MNAKEEILRMLNQKLANYNDSDITDCGGERIKLNNLITATEQAIFDVPSEEECMNHAQRNFSLCFGAAMDMHNFILNYGEWMGAPAFIPESDEFDTPIEYSSKMKAWPIMNVIKNEDNDRI